jgi:hypothetical protein
MCLEMVFLKDEPTALTWRDGDTDQISLFTLAESIAFGAGFFNPLVKTAWRPRRGRRLGRQDLGSYSGPLCPHRRVSYGRLLF